MHILIAPDSFKESLSALEVAKAIETGWQRIFPEASCQLIPMADGGEGTVQSLVDATGGRLINVTVHSPLNEPVDSFFGVSGDGKTAIIEMAAASGLHLVPKAQRNPLKTTSYGTGELIKHALNLGVQKILLGLGGSATNDGGAGMLQALGAKLLDEQRQEIGVGGAALAQLAKIDLSGLDSRLSHIQLDVACDVDNPLCGEQGASAVFGPQKGASPEMVEQLDQALAHFAEIVMQDHQINIRDQKGAGAAGGMGGGVLLLPNARLKAGVDIVLDTLNFAAAAEQADLVITGEGRMDAQSVHGKTPIGVAKVAKQFDKPVVAIVGCLRADYEAVYQHGIDAVFPILREVADLDQTLKAAETNLISTAQNVARLYRL